MARETKGSPADEKKLEQYGVWVKVKPRDVTVPVLDESFELSDLETPKPSAASQGGTRSSSRVAGPVAVEESALTAEEEKLLDELETELEPESTSAVSVPEEEPLLEESELPDIESAARAGSSDVEFAAGDEELPELEEDLGPAPARASAGLESAEVEVPLSDTVAEEESFDDLAALETELASVSTRTRSAAGTAAGGAALAGGSAEILARIEDELKSIRSDLTQLRSDLSGLRRSAAESGGEGPSEEAGIKGGFLDEDEDETIALTGDELDNILNTAEITEEAAETPAVPEPETDLATEETVPEIGGEILEYETPQPEPVEASAVSVEEEVTETLTTDGEIADETLVLSDEDLLPTEAAAAPAAAAEELPEDLVLEEVPIEAGEESAAAEGLPEIDLEGIPEIETEPASTTARPAEEEESETIDLETLDLGEEPKVIDAVPEQVEDVDELEAEEVLEAEEAPTTAAAAHEEMPEVDLEALAAEASDLEEEVPEAPVVEDLEIGELESVVEEPASAAEKEIEISLDEPLEAADEAEVIAEAEEIAAPLEEALEPAGEATDGAIPDNLKDEIRTVLKYMDHLLEALPDDKIQEFASSDYFVMYKKLFEDLGLGE